MDIISAFAMGQASRGNERKVFDWYKAAALIRLAQPGFAHAGLAEDWGSTGGLIYTDGAPVSADETYTYLASTWATPVIELDGEPQDCYLMESESPGWDAKTYWPDGALEILNDSITSRS